MCEERKAIRIKLYEDELVLIIEALSCLPFYKVESLIGKLRAYLQEFVEDN